MKNLRVRIIGFIVVAVIAGCVMGVTGATNSGIMIVALVVFVYFYYIVKANQNHIQAIKAALRTSTLSNEELAEKTNISPKKIDILREDPNYTESELNKLSEVLGVEDQNKKLRKKIILALVGVFGLFLIVYFLFGDDK